MQKRRAREHIISPVQYVHPASRRSLDEAKFIKISNNDLTPKGERRRAHIYEYFYVLSAALKNKRSGFP